MNRDQSEFQEVLVDVPKRDKDGNPISPDSWSSGGARDSNGRVIAQYLNPRPPKSAGEPKVDCENSARRWREEEANERRRKENVELAMLVIDKYVIPVTKTVIIPWAIELWDTKVLPGGKRLAQRVLRPKKSPPEVPHESGDMPEFAAGTANPLSTSQHNTDHTTEISTAQGGGEDTPLADVIQIDEYQNRRSA